MSRIENRFIVLSLMEDLVFPTANSFALASTAPMQTGVGGGRDASVADVLPTADTLEGRLESVAEVAPPYDETPDRRAARVRALKHLPSLLVTMGLQWARNEVVPYLSRCVDEDERALSVGVAEVIPKLLCVQLASTVAGGNTKSSSSFSPFTVSSFCPVITQLCISRDETSRSRIIDVVTEKVLPLASGLEDLGAITTAAFDLVACEWPTGKRSGIALLIAVWSYLHGPKLPEGIENTGRKFSALRNSITVKLRETFSVVDGDRRPHELVLRAFAECIPLLIVPPPSAGGANIFGPPSAAPSEASRIFLSVLGVHDSILDTSEFCLKCCSPPVPWLEAAWRTLDAAARALPKMADAFTRLVGVTTSAAMLSTLTGSVASFRLHPNWKLRHTVGSHLGQLFEISLSMSLTATRTAVQAIQFLNSVVARLCADLEEEVRVTASRCFGGVLEAVVKCKSEIPPHQYDKMFACVLDYCQPLAVDECGSVREALVQSLAEAALSAHNAPPSAASLQDLEAALLCMVMDLLRDDVVSVQLAVVEKLDVFIRCFGSSAVEKGLLDLCDKLQSCGAWRVRLSFAEILAHLCTHILIASRDSAKIPAHDAASLKEFMASELFPRMAAMVFDKAKAVRDKAIQCIGDIADTFNAGQSSAHGRNSFINDEFWPCIASRPEARLTYLSRCAFLTAAFDLRVDRATILRPLVQQLAEDPIANVRMSVAKHIGQALQARVVDAAGDASVLHQFNRLTAVSPSQVFTKFEIDGWVIQTLRKLVEDPDCDVRHFASDALAKCF